MAEKIKHTADIVQKWLKYLFPNEVYALKKLARMLPEHPTVINIGAGGGTSGLAFLESRDDLYLITIDITDESSPFGCLEGEREVLKSAKFWDIGRNEQIHSDSKKAGLEWLSGLNREQVDMVFIDGDHSYEGCTGDIKNWLPNIKNNGIIAIHDYNKKKVFSSGDYDLETTPAKAAWKGVDKAVNDLLIDNFEEVLRVDSLIAFRV